MPHVAHSSCFGLCNSMKPTYYFLIYPLVHWWAPRYPPTPSIKQTVLQGTVLSMFPMGFPGVEIAASELMHRLSFPGSARWLSGMVAPFNTSSCRERGFVCSCFLTIKLHCSLTYSCLIFSRVIGKLLYWAILIYFFNLCFSDYHWVWTFHCILIRFFFDFFFTISFVNCAFLYLAY